MTFTTRKCRAQKRGLKMRKFVAGVIVALVIFVLAPRLADIFYIEPDRMRLDKGTISIISSHNLSEIDSDYLFREQDEQRIFSFSEDISSLNINADSCSREPEEGVGVSQYISSYGLIDPVRERIRTNGNSQRIIIHRRLYCSSYEDSDENDYYYLFFFIFCDIYEEDLCGMSAYQLVRR